MSGMMTAFDRAVLAVVDDALSEHGGDAATVTCSWLEDARMWWIDISPRFEDAASVTIAVLDDELVLGFGRTRVELWASGRGPTPLAELSRYLAAIFGARFEEAGRGDDRFCRIELGGRRAVVGVVHLPLPWRMRRRQRYSPYSTAAAPR